MAAKTARVPKISYTLRDISIAEDALTALLAPSPGPGHLRDISIAEDALTNLKGPLPGQAPTSAPAPAPGALSPSPGMARPASSRGLVVQYRPTRGSLDGQAFSRFFRAALANTSVAGIQVHISVRFGCCCCPVEQRGLLPG